MIAYAEINVAKVQSYRAIKSSWVSDERAYFSAHRNEIPLSGPSVVQDPIGSETAYGRLLGVIRHCEEINQKMELYYRDETASVVGYNNVRFVLPSGTVREIALADYADTPAFELLMEGGSSANMNMPVPETGSVHSVRRNIDGAESRLEALAANAKAIESGTDPALADIKERLDAVMAEMEARKADLMAELEKQKRAAEAQLASFKKQLFMLETQIYGLRCYLGEVVNFYTVRSGSPAKTDAPIVFYQKFRYLDEELGKYCSLYSFGDGRDDKKTLLKMLADREDLADLLAPGPKSVSVVKVSRTGTVKAPSADVANMLDDYAMYHDNQLAILIRNGEQLHITWLDADKINVEDDMFLRPGERVVEAENGTFMNGYFAQKQREEKRKAERNEMVSRWFLFSVIQGVLDNTSLISIPEKANVLEMNSPYIVYSMADGWLADTRYGSFSDMLAKSRNIPLSKGDLVMTVSHISKEGDYRSRDAAWDNDRGIGEKNRTRGVSLPGRAILPVNKVLPGIKVAVTFERVKAVVEMNPNGRPVYELQNRDGSVYLSSYKMDGSVLKGYKPTYKAVAGEVLGRETVEQVIGADAWYGYRGATSYRKLTQVAFRGLCHESETLRYMGENGERYENDLSSAYKKQEEVTYYTKRFVSAEVLGETSHQYYCSVKCNGWSRGYDCHETEYNVNFRFVPDEVIPLPYLCSTWVKAVIRNGNVGELRLFGSKFSFADTLPYLQAILAELKKREEFERDLIVEAGGEKWLEEHSDWDAELVEWRIAKQYRELTPARAKAFFRDMADGKKGECV